MCCGCYLVVVIGPLVCYLWLFLISDMCCLCCMAVCACRLFLSSYLVFRLVYDTDKPLWLDGYLWLDDKACVSCLSTVWICFPLLYILVLLYSIFLSLDMLISTLEASDLAPFYPSVSCIPSRSNSTSALREPLFIIVGFACNFLLVAVSPPH